MAKLIDILPEIEKGRGFKSHDWLNYKYKSALKVLSVEDLLTHGWELEPLPKKELKLFQAVYRIKDFENGKTNFYYIMPEKLYRDKDDATINSQYGRGYSCEVDLVELIPVNLMNPIYEVTE
jgi:hypothetical protein